MWVVKCIIKDFGEEWVSLMTEFSTEREAIEFAECEERSWLWDKVIVEEDV